MSQGGRQTCHTVAEILTEVGLAFTHIGEFALLMNPNFESPYRDRITENEIEIVSVALKKFCVDIEKMCRRIKDRTLLQIRNSMKRHSYEEAGLPLRKQVISASKASLAQERSRNTTPVLPQSSAKSADITLNMLNATEQEVDVEGLSAADKLEYDSADH